MNASYMRLILITQSVFYTAYTTYPEIYYLVCSMIGVHFLQDDMQPDVSSRTSRELQKPKKKVDTLRVMMKLAGM